MHPVEHLYYYSNAFLPSLYLGLSPFILQWNFVHLNIAPGAGHGGWEDSYQADQYRNKPYIFTPGQKFTPGVNSLYLIRGRQIHRVK